MHWTIRQAGDKWEVVDTAGVVIATEATYGLAHAVIGKAAAAQLATQAPTGALPESWRSGPNGIVGQFTTGEKPDDRDFSECSFTWREVPLPLMLQTTTDFGHFGAVLCGWLATVQMEGKSVASTGYFHDTEEGRKARDIIMAQGRFGCSVDPGQVDAEWQCTQIGEDDWGTFCEAGVTIFRSYEIAGLTLTPFPAFAQCWIELDTTTSEEPAPPEEPVAVAASGPLRPPRSWFELSEPDDDDPRWVEQPDGQRGVPLTITADGQVYGHAGLWGTCHIGKNACIQPPVSQAAYAHFHVGEVQCDDGASVATGVLTVGCDHAALALGANDARDWYANSGAGWADVRASNGRAGVWVCGALRPGVDAQALRVLSALALSGDWRRIGGSLELIGILSVNIPGFPVARETVLASAYAESAPATVAPAYRADMVHPLALVASGIVLPTRSYVDSLVAAGSLCGECGGAPRRTPTPRTSEAAAQLAVVLAEVRAMASTVQAIDRRTKHLSSDAVAALGRKLGRE